MIRRIFSTETTGDHRSIKHLHRIWLHLIAALFCMNSSIAWCETTKSNDVPIDISSAAHSDALAFYNDMTGYVFVKCDRATWDALAANRASDFTGLAQASQKMMAACSETISNLEQAFPPESIGTLATVRLNTTLAACKMAYGAKRIFAEKLSERANSPENAAINEELQRQFQVWDIQGQLCVRGIETMAVAAGVSTDEIVKAWLNIYVDCVRYRIRSLSDGDRSLKNYFPLLSLSDEEIRIRLQNLCPGSGPSGLKVVDQPNIIGALDKFLRNRRAELGKALEAINAPGPQAAITLRSLVLSTDDYPPDALKKGEQGVSELTYTIGTEGIITRCKATGASRTLDTKSCEYAINRMAFFPARNGEGKPIEETRTQTVTWVHPDQLH